MLNGLFLGQNGTARLSELSTHGYYGLSCCCCCCWPPAWPSAVSICSSDRLSVCLWSIWRSLLVALRTGVSGWLCRLVPTAACCCACRHWFVYRLHSRRLCVSNRSSGSRDGAELLLLSRAPPPPILARLSLWLTLIVRRPMSPAGGRWPPLFVHRPCRPSPPPPPLPLKWRFFHRIGLDRDASVKIAPSQQDAKCCVARALKRVEPGHWLWLPIWPA